jgi:hypothetical protein
VAQAVAQAGVSRPFPSWNRSILTEIYLCHACTRQEILRTETAGQEEGAGHGAHRRSLWVGGIPDKEVSEEQLAAAFARFGPVEAVQVRRVVESRWSQSASECQRL